MRRVELRTPVGSCLDDEGLRSYVEGRLSQEQSHSAQLHCASCPTCSASVEACLAQTGAGPRAPPASSMTAEAQRTPVPPEFELGHTAESRAPPASPVTDELGHLTPASPMADELSLGHTAASRAPVSSMTDELELERTAAGRTPRGSEMLQDGALERGTTLGRYVLLERIGAGGMGEVYAAYDPQLDRKIALKLLRTSLFAGADASLGRSRLLREAQAVARLAHPNVIGVHDVGTFGDQIFVALEFVEGRTLRAWLDETPRKWEEVLPLFHQAGRGLCAAHAAELIHRDFKPDNVLISKDGRARVLDFGLARTATEAESPALPADANTSPDSGMLSAELTQAGSVLGTPAYMAPEQLLGQSAHARTDQFNFCASLYDALYGVRPFAGSTFAALTAAILERRYTAPVRGQDVPSWVQRAVLRGLAPRAEDRFPSMEALLQALAADPRVRRRKLAVAAVVGVLVAAAAVAGARAQQRAALVCEEADQKLAETWDAPSKERMREAFLATGAAWAPDAWKSVERRLDAYAGTWVMRQRHVCEALRSDGDKADERVWLEKLCLERRLGELQSLTQLFARADREVTENAVAAVDALGSLSACWRQRSLSTPEKPPAEAARRQQLEALRARMLEAKALLDAGKYAPALERAKSVAQDAKDFNYRPLTAEALVLLGRLYDKGDQLESSEQALHDALVAAEGGGHDEATAQGWSLLAWVVGVREARPAEGHRWARHAEAALRRLGDSPELTADLWHREGSIFLGEGRFEEARAHYERALKLRAEALGTEHRDVAASETNVGIANARLGKFEEALVHYERALAILERTVGPEHPSVAGVLTNMGVTYARLGRNDEAVARYERALRLLERALGAEHPQLANALSTLGAAYTRVGRHTQALEAAERGLAIREKALGAEHPQVADSLGALASVRANLGQLEEAEALCRRSLTISQKRLPALHPDLLKRQAEWGAVLVRLGRHGKAIDPLRRALEGLSKSRSPSAASLLLVLENLGVALTAEGKLKEAQAHLRRALDLQEKTGAEPAQRERVRKALAHASGER